MTKHCYDISRQMQDDLIDAYIKVCNEAKPWSQKDAYRLTVKQPAPRYYVSAKQAYQIIARMVRGDFSQVDTFQENRRRMYYSIFDRVMKLSESPLYMGMKLWHIIPFAVASPAPEFFITPKVAEQIRGMIKNGKIDDSGRRLVIKKRRKGRK